MAVERLALNDVLNNKTAHFFKSGSVLRNDENQKLNKIHHMLPAQGNEGTNLEYDVWYDFPKDPKIHGYVYTDAMSKFIYIKPASFQHASRIMIESMKEVVTEEGDMLFKELAIKSLDKYRLRRTKKTFNYVIFLPGTNIIGDIVDWKRIEKEIDKGAYLKCHPLTSAYVFADLKRKYKDRIIDKKLSGHSLLKRAEVVGCCSNSEMGLIGLAQGSKVKVFDRPKAGPRTYTPIYTALWKGDVKNEAYSLDLKRMLSSEYSGLVSYLVHNPKERIDNFFNYFKDIEHVKPKKPKNLNTRG
jgi:hypothetical protein